MQNNADIVIESKDEWSIANNQDLDKTVARQARDHQKTPYENVPPKKVLTNASPLLAVNSRIRERDAVGTSDSIPPKERMSIN